MRIFQNIFLVIFILGFVFHVIKWPGVSVTHGVSIVGILIFLCIVLLRVIRQKINNEINSKELVAAILVISLNLSLLSYSLFKVMYWLTWMHYFQVIALGVSLILLLLFAALDQVRKCIIFFLKEWRVATFFALISLFFMIIPQSSYVYWIEIQPFESRTHSVHCTGYGRYIGSLKREGRLIEAAEFRDRIGDICK